MLILIGSVFSIYGLYVVWLGITHPYWLYIILGVVFAVGGIGLTLKKHWSKNIVYLTALWICGFWFFELIYQISIGSFPYSSHMKNLFSLLPGICVLIFCVGSSLLISRRL